MAKTSLCVLDYQPQRVYWTRATC